MLKRAFWGAERAEHTMAWGRETMAELLANGGIYTSGKSSAPPSTLKSGPTSPVRLLIAAVVQWREDRRGFTAAGGEDYANKQLSEKPVW